MKRAVTAFLVVGALAGASACGSSSRFTFIDPEALFLPVPVESAMRSNPMAELPLGACGVDMMGGYFERPGLLRLRYVGDPREGYLLEWEEDLEVGEGDDALRARLAYFDAEGRFRGIESYGASRGAQTWSPSSGELWLPNPERVDVRRDARPFVIQQRDAAGRPILGHTLQAVTGYYGVVAFEYDAGGRLLRRSERYFVSALAEGRPIREYVTEFEHDGGGRLAVARRYQPGFREAGGEDELVVTWRYDGDRVVEVIREQPFDARGHDVLTRRRERIGWDEAGRVAWRIALTEEGEAAEKRRDDVLFSDGPDGVKEEAPRGPAGEPAVSVDGITEAGGREIARLERIGSDHRVRLVSEPGPGDSAGRVVAGPALRWERFHYVCPEPPIRPVGPGESP